MGLTQKRRFSHRSGNQKFPHGQKKLDLVRSNVKTMLIVFFDIEGINHQEFVLQGQTVNQVFYKDVYEKGFWFLHHNNAPAHSTLSIREILADKKLPVVPHTPYSPDLALSFSKTKICA